MARQGMELAKEFMSPAIVSFTLPLSLSVQITYAMQCQISVKHVSVCGMRYNMSYNITRTFHKMRTQFESSTTN